MSKIKTEDISKIAYLARMGIDEAAIPDYAQSVSEILDFVEQMNLVDTSQIEPMAHPQDMEQRLRDDTITETDQRDLLMKNAPRSEAGLFLVPKVIE